MSRVQVRGEAVFGREEELSEVREEQAGLVRGEEEGWVRGFSSAVSLAARAWVKYGPDRSRSGVSFSRPGFCVFCGKLVMARGSGDEGRSAWDCGSTECGGSSWFGEEGARTYGGKDEWECPCGCLFAVPGGEEEAL